MVKQAEAMRELEEVRDGKLFFDGCDLTRLAEDFGTPLYVFSQNGIENRIEELKRDFLQPYENTRVAYAAKAFCTKAIFKLMEKHGFCIDVVSGGELYTAAAAGFPAERIEFNGNNKSDEELEFAVEYGIGRIIIDGLSELEKIEEICGRKKKKMKVLYRITPGVKSDTHDYIVTGKKDSKFGIPLDDAILLPAVKKALDSEHVDFMGLHFHVGSQLFDNTSHLQALEIILTLAEKIKKEYGYDMKELNLGGGFGSRYTTETRKPFAYFLRPMMERIEDFYSRQGVRRPAVVIEPGRSIVAEAGMELYRVGSIKEIPGVRKYVAVDGGMSDNLRPMLYQAVYDGILANKADQENSDEVTVCGKCCESGDVLIKDIKLAMPERGDILAVRSTGAYGYSMASNYNKNPISAVVFVKNGEARLAVRRQSYEEMLEREENLEF